MFAKQNLLYALFLSVINLASCDPPFNNPPGVDVWCGKAYRETNSSFDPGGWLDPPTLNNGTNPLRLSLHIYPRYSFYTESETKASLIVDTRVSDHDPYGGPYENSTHDPNVSNSTVIPFTELLLTFWDPDVIIINNTRVPVNVSGFEIPIDLELVKGPGGEAGWGGVFNVVGKSPDGLQTYEDHVRVWVYPERKDGGSLARLDRLDGGIYVRSPLTEDRWKPLLPFGFYTRWDWISWLVDPENNSEPPNLASNNTKSLAEYKERGYNLIHPVPPGGWESFDTATFEKFLSICDELELYVMYDMRHTYLNLSSIQYQLPRLKAHPSLLLYYTGDEPDGSTDPLNGTLLAYESIRNIDPYHPVSLVLNCYNFYFKEYTSGADIILEDTYNLIQSSTFSPVYNTVCNRTYGDCGCDFCHVNDTAYPEFVEHPFQDVVERVDNFYQYQRWIGQGATKPVWGVPQWFFDADSFWSRWAMPDEAIVMALLRINHGAEGIVGWLFPTSPEIESATTDLAKVLAREDVTALLVDTPGQRLSVAPGSDRDLDIAAWVGEEEMLISIVWAENHVGNGAVILLPREVSSVETLYGDEWGFHGGDSIFKEGVLPLTVSILKARIAGY